MDKNDYHIWDENGKLIDPNKPKAKIPVSKKKYPKIKEGEYEAVCINVDINRKFKGIHKAYFYFRICSGQYDGTITEMYCNYSDKEMNESWKYWQAWAIANKGTPDDGQELSPDIFIDNKFKIYVGKTNKKFEDGESKPDFLQNPVVKEIKILIK